MAKNTGIGVILPGFFFSTLCVILEKITILLALCFPQFCKMGIIILALFNNMLGYLKCVLKMFLKQFKMETISKPVIHEALANG